MEGYIPAVITPKKLMRLLGIRSVASLYKLPIPRCPLSHAGSRKYVFLASDVLDYVRSQRDANEINLD